MEKYFTMTSLIRDRFWTKSFFEKMSPTVDEVKKVCYYGGVRMANVYSLSQILKFEQTEEFKIISEKCKKRRISPMERLEKKKLKEKDAEIENRYKKYLENRLNGSLPDNKIEKLEDIEKEIMERIQVAIIPEEKVWINCFGSLNTYNKYISLKNDPDSTNWRMYIERVKNNYIRHNLTNYDALLKEFALRIGDENAYRVLHKPMKDRIKQIYPTYSRGDFNHANPYNERDDLEYFIENRF